MGIDAVLSAAVTAADLPPPIGDQDPVSEWIRENREKWAGVVGWFSRERASGTPMLERLAEAAVDAVVRLTRTLGRLNERRTRPVDRAADFRTLARWFSGCASDADAHRLWQSAFGLYSARHFHIGEDDVDATNAGTSWWNAPPAEIPVRLRTRGRLSEAGRPAPVADHTMEKEWIAQRRRAERAQIDAAIRRFARQEKLRFSDIAILDASEFDLLLALLDQALSAPGQSDGTRWPAPRTAGLRSPFIPPSPGMRASSYCEHHGAISDAETIASPCPTPSTTLAAGRPPGRVARERRSRIHAVRCSANRTLGSYSISPEKAARP